MDNEKFRVGFIRCGRGVADINRGCETSSTRISTDHGTD